MFSRGTMHIVRDFANKNKWYFVVDECAKDVSSFPPTQITII